MTRVASSPPASPRKISLSAQEQQYSHIHSYSNPYSPQRPRGPRRHSEKRLSNTSDQFSSQQTLVASSSEDSNAPEGDHKMLVSPRHMPADHMVGNGKAGTPLYARSRPASGVTPVDISGKRSSDNHFVGGGGGAVAEAGDEEMTRAPYRDRMLSESVISLTGVAEEDEHTQHHHTRQHHHQHHPTTPSLIPPVLSQDDDTLFAQLALGASRASPMIRASSQRRISQEIQLACNGLGSPRLSAVSGDHVVPVSPLRREAAPMRRSSTRASATAAAAAVPLTAARQQTRSPAVVGDSFAFGDSSYSSSNASALAAADEYFGQAGSSMDEASPSALPLHQRLPFPRSVSSSHADSPSARRIGRHLPLFGAQSTDTVDVVPVSPRLNAIRLASVQGRHVRYSSDLHIARPNFASSRSEMSLDERSRSRRSSEMGSLYTNTLSDSASMSGVKMSRDTSVKPSKHRLILKEGGKPDVTLQLGNCIGRGQFGSVYRALNLNTGQMVAVKRIKHQGRSEEEVMQLMREVELLKSLVHPSVVKYEGLVRGDDVVSIVLEYVENGSLLHTLKAFGNFPEKLVASYVVKILEGLQYLHENDVVHCDLKAANILTTKNGNVKLSDFGVSLNLKAAEDLKKNDAIGTPNWMAPEVIELKGASTSADVWSLGCTIIELLTGKPPYGDMLAMSAMWRIVEDDRPPLPDSISDSLTDFLTACFHKDPLLRPSAIKLTDHAWLHTTWTDQKALRAQDSVPFFKRVASPDQRKGSVRKSDGYSGKGSTGRSRQLTVTQADVLLMPTSPMSDFTSSIDGVSSMERSTSSPSTSAALRPHLVSMRAASAPDAWSSKAFQEAPAEKAGGEDDSAATTPLYSPVGGNTNLSLSPANGMLTDAMGRRGSDMTSTSTSLDLLRSPNALSAVDKIDRVEVVVGPLSPSMLDLVSPPQDVFMLDEQANKAHAFVKSTFSKPVQCKICRESVRKHAVLCEECGLICHASCARRAATACSLRAQLLMMAGNQRSSMDITRVLSPAPSSSTPPPQPPTPTTAYIASPPLFRFPFGKYKRNAKLSGSDLNLPSSVPLPTSPTTPSLPQSPCTPMPSADDGSGQKRRRRISLLPSHLSRHRSPPSAAPRSIIKQAPMAFGAAAAAAAAAARPSAPMPTGAEGSTDEASRMVRSHSSSQSIQDDSVGYGSSASSLSSSFRLGSPTSQASSSNRKQFPAFEVRNSIQSATATGPTTTQALVQLPHVQLQPAPRGFMAGRRQRHTSASAAQPSLGSTPNLLASRAAVTFAPISKSPGLGPTPPVRQSSHDVPMASQDCKPHNLPGRRERRMSDATGGKTDATKSSSGPERRQNRRISAKEDCVIA